MSFQSLRNLEKKCDKKTEHLCLFNKNYDVTSRTSTFKCRSGVTGQNQVKLGTLMKQDDKNSKI